MSQVLPAWKPRYALTTWMFNKRDTALEVMAETLRQKKAAGQFNKEALLAALDADSSEDDTTEDDDDDDEAEEGSGKGVNRKAAMSVMMQLLKRKQEQKKKAALGEAVAVS